MRYAVLLFAAVCVLPHTPLLAPAGPPDRVYLFTAEWCAPCRRYAPQWRRIEAKLKRDGIIADALYEAKWQTEHERFKIAKYPTIVFVRNNREFKRVSGALTQDQIYKILEEPGQ